MKKYYLLVFINLYCSYYFSQVSQTRGGILAQEYSKELTEYKVKSFLVNEIFQLKEYDVISLEVNSITASKSGELTSVVYKSKYQDKKGLVFGFYGSYVNEFNLPYTGYSFKNMDFEKAKQFFDSVDVVLKDYDIFFNPTSDAIIPLDLNVIFKFDDMTFIFYKGSLNLNLIRVIWEDYDSEWSLTNLKTTQKRFNQFFN
jgi:hypothetical protein